MDLSFSEPTLPTLPGLAWRTLRPADAPSLEELLFACARADGDILHGFIPGQVAAGSSAEGGRSRALGAVDEAGRLAAYVSVAVDEVVDGDRVTVTGRVRPSYRRRSIGAALMRWADARMAELVAERPAVRPAVARTSTEALDPAKVALYARAGFTLQFAEDVMRRDLARPLPPAPVPGDITFEAWTAGNAARFFEVYRAAFRDRPGFPDPPAATWIDWIAGGEDFRPDLSLLAVSGDRPVGYVACDVDRLGTMPEEERGGWISQVGVRPEWRGRGIVDALILRVLQGVAAAGLPAALLHVNVNNPRAARAYARLGFVPIGRRATYTKPINRS